MPGPRNLLTAPEQLPLVAPSILSADFAALSDDCGHALESGGDLLHVDIMDGHFVPNLTMGPELVRRLRAALPEAFLDVHLMVTDPANFFEPFARAGANHVTFHVEVTPSPRVVELIERVHGLGMTAGLAINPPTGVEAILPHMGKADLLLVMSVNPGFSGQSFIESVLEKTRWLKGLMRLDQRLQMDGGINLSNAARVREAGCDVLVAATAFFGVARGQRAEVARGLRGSK